MTSIYLKTEFVEVDCGHESHGPGGFTFAMTRTFYDETHRGRSWYCPMGHRRAWLGQTTEQQLARSQARETALQDQLSAAIRDAEATRVALLRDRQRFVNGVCPCCNRSFENVRRHMASKHPDYDVTKVSAERLRLFKCSCGRAFETLRGLRTHQGHLRRDGWDSPDAGSWRAHLTRT